MEFISSIISSISGYMYSYILIALLIAAGIYFSFRTKFVQIRLFKESVRVITEKKKHKDSISSFQALMVSTVSYPNRCRKTARWRAAACQEIYGIFLEPPRREQVRP